MLSRLFPESLCHMTVKRQLKPRFDMVKIVVFAKESVVYNAT